MSVQDRHKLSCPTKVVFGPSSFPLNWESMGGEKGAVKEVLSVIEERQKRNLWKEKKRKQLEKEELWGVCLQWH